MSAKIEREFKLRLPDERALEALLARLGGTRVEPVLQVNHFFDTPAGALRKARIALRLRLEAGRASLALKGPARAAAASGVEAALAARSEHEVPIDRESAERVLAGTLAPLAALRAGGLSGTPLLERVSRLAGSDPLRHLGSFENERLTIGPSTLPGFPSPLVFELDRTRFPGGRVERELEVEIPAHASAAEIGACLARLLASVGLAVEAAPSKLERFLQILDGRNRAR